MNKINLQIGFLILVIFAVAFIRILPQPLNFSPLAAVALFGAAHFAKRWQALLIPIAAIWLSDLFVNNVIYAHYYNGFVLFYEGFYWQYGAYLLVALAGIALYRNEISTKTVLVGALGSGILFFLVSNFGVWAGSTMYSKDLAGLLSCYAAGIPFYKNTLMGDVFYTVTLFGGYYLLQRNVDFFKLPHVKYA
ncbi:MAG: DUF6580 family putative transport protein [Pseudomonadota bacterium]